MNLRFLGTGTSQGIPVIGCQCKVCHSSNPKDKRLRCAALVTEGNTNLLIDSGPDIRYQMLRSNTESLHSVLITHEHYDHTGGLDDLRPFGFMNQAGIDIYAQQEVVANIKIKYDYAFGEQKYPGSPRFNLKIIEPFQALVFNEIEVLPLTVQHGNLNIVGFKFNDNLAYITDANGIPPETLEHIKGIDWLVINALHHDSHHSHFHLTQTLETISRIAPKNVYLIHMSHLMGLHEEVEANLPFPCKLAYDNLILQTG